MNSCDNHLVYSLDDAYIHMSISKNLAEYGIWGVTKYEFASCSSSLIWTLLLAAVYYIFSPNEITPFIFNIIPAVLIIISAYFLLLKSGVTGKIYQLSVLIFIILLPPLPPLIFTGLEHVLHILISILFVYFAAETLSGNYNKKFILITALLAILLPVIRYEGIAIVTGFCFLLILQRKWFASLAIFVSAILPVFIFGLVSISKGWSFFPNSLMLKASLPDVYSFDDFIGFIGVLGDGFLPNGRFIIFISMFTLLIISIIIYSYYKSSLWLKKRNFNLLTLLFFNVGLYLVYSRSGWSYRYQSFIISLSIFVLSVILYKYFSNDSVIPKWRNFAVRTVTILVIIVIGVYGVKLISEIPATARNIYEQQYQMGIFLKEYYNGSAVALNDIGACNYFADIKCVDMWGLSDIEISKMRRKENFTKEDIRKVTTRKNVRIAIVYDSWFEENGSIMLPGEWIKTGEWKIIDNIIAGDDVVSFYAVNREEEIHLMNNLRQFSSRLPQTVIQKGKYLN